MSWALNIGLYALNNKRRLENDLHPKKICCR